MARGDLVGGSWSAEDQSECAGDSQCDGGRDEAGKRALSDEENRSEPARAGRHQQPRVKRLTTLL